MAKTKGKLWYAADAEEFGDPALADAERAYRSESGDKPWARGFIQRFEAWLESSVGKEPTPSPG
jgi:hypothetical protein